MGGPMAANLVKKGHTVYGFDLSPAALDALAAAGGYKCNTAADAAKASEFVVVMLQNAAQVKSTLAISFLQQLQPGTMIVDGSTIDVDTSRSLSRLVSQYGCCMIDAPVSGGINGAIAGTLSFMVGGSADDLERARPILECMGQNIFHAGGSGSGLAAKICNNVALAIHMIGTSEAISLGVKLGLDPAVVSSIMQKSTGNSWSLEKYNPYPGVMENVPSSRGYTGGFAVDLMVKDLGLAAGAALQAKASTPLGSTAFNLYKMWSDSGKGKTDFSSIIQLLYKHEL